MSDTTADSQSTNPNEFIRIPHRLTRALQIGFKERLLFDMTNDERLVQMTHDIAYETCAEIHEFSEELTHLAVQLMLNELFQWVDNGLRVGLRTVRRVSKVK